MHPQHRPAKHKSVAWFNSDSNLRDYRCHQNKQVSIKTSNFPPHQDFRVTMGRFGTKGINGFQVATTDSEAGGSFTVTYSIPQALRGCDRIAIRLQGTASY